jgi:hypothetical protein
MGAHTTGPEPGIKQNRIFAVCGSENVFQVQEIKFCRAETTKLRDILTFERVFLAVT